MFEACVPTVCCVLCVGSNLQPLSLLGGYDIPTLRSNTVTVMPGEGSVLEWLGSSSSLRVVKGVVFVSSGHCNVWSLQRQPRTFTRPKQSTCHTGAHTSRI